MKWLNLEDGSCVNADYLSRIYIERRLVRGVKKWRTYVVMENEPFLWHTDLTREDAFNRLQAIIAWMEESESRAL